MDHDDVALPSLDEPRLIERLVSRGPYARLMRVETVASTNLELQRALTGGAEGGRWPHLSVLTAEEQTGALGRLSRSWSSPGGASLSTSVVLRPAWPAEMLSWLSLLAGRSLVRVLREDHGLPAALKWPNDVHVEGRKISGILALAVPPTPGEGEGRPAVVLGCGVNVLLTEEQLPTEASTSLLLERERTGRGRLIPGTGEAAALRTDLLAGFLETFAEELSRTEREFAEAEPTVPASSGAAALALRDRIAEVMDTLGLEVRLELPDGGAVRGWATELTTEGSLVVEVTHRRAAAEERWSPHRSGRIEFSAGDVVHLRRAND